MTTEGGQRGPQQGQFEASKSIENWGLRVSGFRVYGLLGNCEQHLASRTGHAVLQNAGVKGEK